MISQEVVKSLMGMKQMECFTCMHPQEVGWCENNCHKDEIYDMAIEALEKQMPKKPIKRWTGDEWVIKCPVCGKYFDVSEYEWARQFCGGCGQAIDWECDTE